MYAGDIKLLPGEKLFNLEYADDIISLCNNIQATQIVHNQLAISIRRYDTYFVLSKCEVFSQDRWERVLL